MFTSRSSLEYPTNSHGLIVWAETPIPALFSDYKSPSTPARSHIAGTITGDLHMSYPLSYPLIPNERNIKLRAHEIETDFWTIVNHPVANYPSMEGSDVLRADMVAHDIVEHVNGWENICTVEDELEALGAVIMSRVDPGELETHHLKTDIMNTYSYATYRELDKAPVRKLNLLIEELYADDLRFTREELKDSIGIDMEDAVIPMDEILLWVSSGYEKAKQIYHLHEFHMNNMFNYVKQAVEKVCPESWVTYNLYINNETQTVILTEDEHPW